MKKSDLLRLLKDVGQNEEIAFDAGGCASWLHQINCVARVRFGRLDSESGEHMVLLCESDADGDDVLDKYASARRLESRRKFTDFEIISVAAIVRTDGGDRNGTHTVLLGSQIEQPDYPREW